MTAEEEEAVQDELAELQTLVDETEQKHLPSVPAGEIFEEELETVVGTPRKSKAERVALEA